jgi:hypothetical protein
MTKEARTLKREVTPDLADYFDIRASSFLRHLSFVLRHSYVDLAEKHECEFRRFQFRKAPIINVA